jgi:hypothetical protein
MSNDERQPPRKPDLEISRANGGAWDNRADGGGINLTLRITLKDVAERIQEAKESARDAREGERRDDKRSSSREEQRDTAPRYER